MKALILDGRVVDTSQTTFEVHPNMFWLDSPQDCKVGWLYDGSTFIEPEVVEDILFHNTMQAYRRAFRLALHQTPYGETNILVAIEAHVATLDPYNSVRMAWGDVTIFERNHPDMSMFSELGLSDEQIDDIFRLAQSIEAGA